MCGISGILRRPEARHVELCDDRQRHRGPDDCAHYADPLGRAELWFRRLAILDLSSAGRQPMPNEDGTVWLVFNGEIYNYRPLRAELEARGHVFRSRTDSEVLLHLWEECGKRMLDRLNGMFAFAIWDERTGEAFLARDHAGIKPLYISRSDGELAFASEAKVLLSLPWVDRAIDPIALRQYLTFLYVPEERTMWRGIRKLPAAGWLSWTPERVETGTWWDWDQSIQEERPPAEWAAAVRATLLETVERQLVSDVPLGALLSGGLDSSAVVAAACELRSGERVRAYTSRVVHDGQLDYADDLPYAREVATRLGIDLVEKEIAPSLTELLPLLVWHTDEPIADPAIANSYLLCRGAREDGTVVLLSGNGGDELYHGYRTHTAIRLSSRAPVIPPPLARVASALAGDVVDRFGLSTRNAPRRALRMLRFLGASPEQRIVELADWSSPSVRARVLRHEERTEPLDVYGDFVRHFERSRARTDEERWTYVLFKTFLPAHALAYGDRTSMASSVELRVPLLDRAMVEQAARIPVSLKYRDGQQKWILAEAVKDLLPPSIRTRPKTGFGIPLRQWLAGDLYRQMRQVLLGERFHARGLFDRTGVEATLCDLETNRRDVAYTVWALFTFEMWARTFVDAEGTSPIAGIGE
jgi:asparagine synthase (glutamine-hydrolysing)